MRVLLRRERRRRNIISFQGHALPLPHNTLVDRHELFSHPTRYPENRMLVTRNHFLASGVRHSPLPLSHCSVYDDIEVALESALARRPLSLIIDLEGWSTPVLVLLDQLRELRQKYPTLEIALLTGTQDSLLQHFLRTACDCRLIDKSLTLQLMRQQLQLHHPERPIRLRKFKAREWSVLLLMSQGLAFCDIARLQNRPYHRIIYRAGCVLSLLQLEHRHQLLRLLQRINSLSAAHHSK